MFSEIKECTNNNDYTGAIYLIAKMYKYDEEAKILKKISEIHSIEGHMPGELGMYRLTILNRLLRSIGEKFGESEVDKILEAL
jgi:hypothetical protein